MKDFWSHSKLQYHSLFTYFFKYYAKYTFISGLLKNCLALKLGEGISKPTMLDFLGEGKALPAVSCSHSGFFVTKR